MAAFEKMVQETKPDLLIVTTVDTTHSDYIVRGMELGVNVLTEKPMTTDEKKANKSIREYLLTHGNFSFAVLFAILWNT